MDYHYRFCRLLLGALALSGIFSGCMGGHALHDDPRPAATLASPANVPSELSKITLPPYVIEPPDILVIDVFTLPKDKGQPAVVLSPQPITGQHLVTPDGTVNMGIWGSLSLAGLTKEQAKEAIRRHVYQQIRTQSIIREKGTDVDDPNKLFVAVDVLSYNSKRYYVITDGAGYGEQIYHFPIMGSETVMDALANINGLPMVGSKNDIWIARRTPHASQHEQILNVDYVGITKRGETRTNYQILPGDRIYVQAEKVFIIDNFMQKVLTPVERLLGLSLLGSSSYNSITNRRQPTNGN